MKKKSKVQSFLNCKMTQKIKSAKALQKLMNQPFLSDCLD